jgi:hypothetical protein
VFRIVRQLRIPSHSLFVSGAMKESEESITPDVPLARGKRLTQKFSLVALRESDYLMRCCIEDGVMP